MKRNWLAEVLLVLFIGLLILMIFTMIQSVRAEETEGWILCQPDSFVNIRQGPAKNAQVVGWLELGDPVFLDGKQKNGFLHITGVSNENGEGWVSASFVARDRPQIETVNAWIDAEGRVACRRAINGNRRKWLHGGDAIILYASSAEWSITNEGFIRTEFILAER